MILSDNEKALLRAAGALIRASHQDQLFSVAQAGEIAKLTRQETLEIAERLEAEGWIVRAGLPHGWACVWGPCMDWINDDFIQQYTLNFAQDREAILLGVYRVANGRQFITVDAGAVAAELGVQGKRLEEALAFMKRNHLRAGIIDRPQSVMLTDSGVREAERIIGATPLAYPAAPLRRASTFRAVSHFP